MGDTRPTSRTVPVLLRRSVLLAAAGLLGGSVVLWLVLAAMGAPALLTGVVQLLAVVALAVSAGVRRDRELRLGFLAGREPLAIDTQAADLLASRGVAPSRRSVVRIVAAWREAGLFIGVDPRLLRADDDLAHAYGHARASTYGPRPVGAFELELNRTSRPGAAQLRLAPESGAKCGSCGYSLAGLPDNTVCPECGRPQIRIRTLGDYVLYVAGAWPGADGPAGR